MKVQAPMFFAASRRAKASGMRTSMARMLSVLVGCMGSLWLSAAPAEAQSSNAQVALTIAYIDKHWASSRYKTRSQPVQGFLLPLGTMKKIHGVWRPETFQPIDGELERVTWQISGESINTLFADVVSQLSSRARLQWECRGRSCGNGAEWANRVYQERLLYGRDESMNYAAFKTEEGVWLTIFSAARTADRQYLHLDIATPQ